MKFYIRTKNVMTRKDRTRFVGLSEAGERRGQEGGVKKRRVGSWVGNERCVAFTHVHSYSKRTNVDSPFS